MLTIHSCGLLVVPPAACEFAIRKVIIHKAHEDFLISIDRLVVAPVVVLHGIAVRDMCLVSREILGSKRIHDYETIKRRSCGVADGVVNQVGPSGMARGNSELVKAHTPRRGRPSCRNSDIQLRSRLAQVSSLGAQRRPGDRRRGTRTRVPVTRSEADHGPRMQHPGRLGDRGGAGWRRTGPSRRRAGAGGPGVDPGRRRLSGVLAGRSTH